jgi:hypothetical protein
MSETCAVCKKGIGPAKCEICGFSDDGSINRSFPVPEDLNNWLETVVKPYRASWEAKKEKDKLLAELEEAKRREAELLAQVNSLANKKTETTRTLPPLRQPPLSKRIFLWISRIFSVFVYIMFIFGICIFIQNIMRMSVIAIFISLVAILSGILVTYLSILDSIEGEDFARHGVLFLSRMFCILSLIGLFIVCLWGIWDSIQSIMRGEEILGSLVVIISGGISCVVIAFFPAFAIRSIIKDGLRYSLDKLRKEI